MNRHLLALILSVAGLAACTDPEPAAQAACMALPQLATDDVGLAALTPLLDPREVTILKQAQPTLGMAKVGPEGLAKIREGISCTVDQVDSAGSKRWAVKLTRSQPVVAADGTIGDNEDVTLDWQVVAGGDGPYVESGLRMADSKRASLDKAIEERDYMRVASGWRGIVQSFPDPVLSVDIAEAELLDKGWQYRKKLVPVGAGALDPETVALQIENQGEQIISKSIVDLTFTHGGKTETVRLVGGELGPGGTIQLQGTTKGPMAADVGGFKPEVVMVEVQAGSL